MYLNFFLSEGYFSIFCHDGEKILFKEKVADDKVVNLPLNFQHILNRIKEQKLTIDVITCSVGPVSFSGDRLVLAFAAGFAKAMKKELYGISLFEILDTIAVDQGLEDCFVMLDSKKDSFVFWKDGAKCTIEKTKLATELPTLKIKNLVALGEELGEKQDSIKNIIYIKDITDEMYARAINVKFADKSLRIATEPEYIKEPNISSNIKMAKKV